MSIETMVLRTDTDTLTEYATTYARYFTQTEREFIRHALDERRSIALAISSLSSSPARWSEIHGLSFLITDDTPTGKAA